MWVGEFSLSLSDARQRPVDVPPPRGSFQFLKKEPETPYKPVETHSLQIKDLQMASTGSARTEGLVQHCPN
ncbi:hypothetical protein NTG1052_560011 [Candidatus Nitrotoga sp. 1052]|nr:hypothetical protein NTG1052_560011 [Candidatus Nitrotoga sp. 1052]